MVRVATVRYFRLFVYMCAAVSKLAYRKGRATETNAVLIPGGKPGVWIAGTLGFTVTLGSIVLACIPPNDVVNVTGFELKLISGTVISIAIGLLLFLRGARRQRVRVAE